MTLDIERLEILLKIAQEHNVSLDDLEDQTWHLDWQAFLRWSAKFLQPQAKQGQNFRSRPQSATLRPYLKFANDKAG